MTLSLEGLRREAGRTGFRPEVLEKVHWLLDLLQAMRRHPYLKSRVVLKGGTALNLFVFDVPRLSVDIDLNYIGALDRETMLAERPVLERAMEAVTSRLGLVLQTAPDAHAGGKWRLRHESALVRAAHWSSTSTTCTAYRFGRLLRLSPGPSGRGRCRTSRCSTSTNWRAGSLRRC